MLRAKEIDQEVLQSSNYGTFSNLTQEQEVHIAVSAGEQQPATSATDEFENEDIQPRHQQQTPVLIDIEEEIIQHNNNGRALQRRRRYTLLRVRVRVRVHYFFSLLLWQLHWVQYWVGTKTHRVIPLLLVHLT